MKPIIINGEQWWYEDNTYVTNWGKVIPKTYFYKKRTITKKKRKYLDLFGPWVTFEVKNQYPDYIINLDIEDPKHTKEEIKKVIDTMLVTMKRKEEIKNGEII